MKILAPLIGILLVLGIGLTVGKDVILKIALAGGVKSATGLELSIEKIKFDLVDTLIDVKNTQLYNPSGYPERVLCSMPALFLDLEAKDLLKGKIHFEDISLHVNELRAIRNSKGELNLNSLRPVKTGPREKEKRKIEEKREAQPKPSRLQVDHLKIKIDKVFYQDFSQGDATPLVKEFDVNIEEEFTDVTNAQDLVRIVLVKALAKTEIARLTGFDIGGLKTLVKGQLGGVEAFKTTAEETAKDLAEKMKNLF